MKLWDKGFEPDKMIEEFTVGQDRELDLQLARYDVEGSMAHITMLESIGLLKKDELDTLLKGLREILDTINRGEFRIEEGVEDVHSQVEFMLTERYGDLGKKIHSGRSRNDQVLVDLKLFMRDQLRRIAEATGHLFDRLQLLSEEYKEVLMPGYTHLQVAMPSSFGLWFGAYAESLVDDLRMLHAAYEIADQNPLGSAAGYGSSFPLNRTMTTKLLEFSDLHYNVVAAQMSRGKTERAAAMGISAIASTLGRFAMDVCMWMCQNFAFISFPDEFTTGSSIMPQKKNPDVAELVVGPTELVMMDQTGVPSQPSNPFSWRQPLMRGALVGVLLSLALLYLSGRAWATVMTRDDLQKVTSARYLGALPAVRVKKRSRTTPATLSEELARSSAYCEAMRIVSMRIDKAMQSHAYRTLLVSSAAPGEGKTTFVCQLADALSRQGRHVLVIDCDLRNPSVHKTLGRPAQAGLAEDLAGADRDGTRQGKARCDLCRQARRDADRAARRRCIPVAAG